MRLIPVLLLVMLDSIAPATAPAQAARLTGVSIERFSGYGRFTAVNFRRTDLGPSRVGLDVAIGLVPDYLRDRTLVADLDAGLACVAPVGPVVLLIKGGPASLVAVGEVSKFYFGLQGGAAVVVPLERRSNLRLDVSRRIYFAPAESTVRMWSVGIGFTVGLLR